MPCTGNVRGVDAVEKLAADADLEGVALLHAGREDVSDVWRLLRERDGG